MKNSFTYIIALLVLLGIVSNLYAAEKHQSKPELIDQIVAIVNKDVITQADLEIAIKQAKAQMQGAQNNSPSELKKEVLQNLINKKIALQLAENNNIVVSSLEVSRTIDNILSQNNITLEQLKTQLSYSGINYKEYRQNIKDQITISKLQQQAIANTIYISPQDIQEYIDKHLSNNIKYNLKHILLPLPKDYTDEQESKAMSEAEHLVKKIKSNELSFSGAAKKYSKSTDAQNGGELGYMSLESLPSIFADHVTTMEKGQIYGPYIANGSIQIIKLAGKKTIEPQQHYITQYHLQQIKINITPIVDSQQAKDQLQRILISIRNGKSFSKLAQQYSQNDGNTNGKGDLGWQSENKLSFQIKEIVDQLSVGEVSQPFREDKSWMIIKLLGKRQKNDTEAYLKQKASNTLFQQKAKQAIKSWMASLRDNAFVKITVDELKK